VTVTVAASGRVTEQHLVEVGAAMSLDVCLDPPGQLVDCLHVIDTGRRPKQVAFHPNGEELWVTLLKGPPAVQVFSTGTGALLAEIELNGHGAVELVFAADGRRAWVSQMATPTVFELDTQERRVLRALPTGGRWSKVLALSPDERRLYVSNWLDDDVTELDLASGSQLRHLATAKTPRGLWVSPAGDGLVVASFGSGVLERVELATGERTTLLSGGKSLRHIVADAGGSTLYVSDMGRNRVWQVALDGTPARVFASGNANPNTLALSADGQILAVSNRGKNGAVWPGPGETWGSIGVYDTRDGALLDVIVGGNQCTGLSLSPDDRLLAFSDYQDDRIRLYRLPPVEELRNGGGGRAQSRRRDVKKRSPG
jgi:DNA-binding beta-propeller fold protein YncE